MAPEWSQNDLDPYPCIIFISGDLVLAKRPHDGSVWKWGHTIRTVFFLNGEHNYVYIYIYTYTLQYIINSGFYSTCSDTPTMTMQSRSGKAGAGPLKASHAMQIYGAASAMLCGRWRQRCRRYETSTICMSFPMGKRMGFHSYVCFSGRVGFNMSMVISSIFAWMGQSVSSWQ